MSMVRYSSDEVFKELSAALEYFGLGEMEYYQHCDVHDYRVNMVFTKDFSRLALQNPIEIFDTVGEFRKSLEDSKFFRELKTLHNKEIQELTDKINKLEETNHKLIEHIDNGEEFIDSYEDKD